MKQFPLAIAGALSATCLSAFAQGTNGQETSLDSLQAWEVRANTYTNSSQEDPSVAVDANGRILSTWSSRRQEGGNYGVFAQLLDPLGRPLGTEIHVNQSTIGAQQDSYVVFAPDGSAWIVWSSLHRYSPSNGIFMRKLTQTDDGFVVDGDEIWVGGEPQDLYTDPAIAVNSDGELLVAYVVNKADGLEILGRRLSATGEPIGAPLHLGEQKFGHERAPDVIATPDGEFIVVWQSSKKNATELSIVARNVAKDGTLGKTFVVNDLEDRQHVEPSIDIDDAGNWLVAWMSVAAGQSNWEVRARRFDKSQKPLGDSFAVEGAGGGSHNGATAVCAPDGRFLVAYNATGGRYTKDNGKQGTQVDIWAQAYNADGTTDGEGYRVNEEAQGSHAMQVATNGRHAQWTDDQLVFTWAGKSKNDGSGIAVRILADEGFDAPAPPAVEPVAACADLAFTESNSEARPDPIPDWAKRIPRVAAPLGPGTGGFVGHDETVWSPPDPDLAVGPDMVIAQVNMEIAAFTKAGVELWRMDNTSPGFYSAQGAEDFVFDPISTYDWHSQRFIVANSELASDGDYICFAVSKDSHPDDANDWWKFRVKTSPTCNLPDFPNLGVNRDFIYVTTDCFQGGGNRVMIFNKANVANGTLGTWWNQPMDPNLQSLGNTKNYDSDHSRQYFVSAGFGGGSQLRIQCKRTPTAAPDSFSLNVPGFGSPSGAPQQGSSALLSTIDARIKHGVVRNGRLYTAHGIGTGGVTKVRWYEIDLGNWPISGSPSVIQQGDLDLGAGVYSWFPDICPDANGNVTISYNRSASNEPGSIEAVYRLASDTPGTMRPPVRLQTNTVPYTQPRWGDYAGVEEDPADPGIFWSHLEYCVGPWETWVGKWDIGTAEPGIAFGGGATGCPCGNINDGSAAPLLAGCDNGTYASGCSMTASGDASISNDTVVFAGLNAANSTFGVFFQGDNQALPGSPLGTAPNGLLQVSGNITRFDPVTTNGSGYCDTTGYTQSISVQGGANAGDTKHYQLWYRNPGNTAPCTPFIPGGSNSSNGYSITWLP